MDSTCSQTSLVSAYVNFATQQHDVSLLDLPRHILYAILQQLGFIDLSNAGRTCQLLNKMAAHPSLWPSFKNDNWALWDVRCALAHKLRLPPQVQP